MTSFDNRSTQAAPELVNSNAPEVSELTDASISPLQPDIDPIFYNPPPFPVSSDSSFGGSSYLVSASRIQPEELAQNPQKFFEQVGLTLQLQGYALHKELSQALMTEVFNEVTPLPLGGKHPLNSPVCPPDPAVTAWFKQSQSAHT